MVSFDIIADIHGQHGKLQALLRKLGYCQKEGAWRHPNRRAIFVGDFVDRGPEQLCTVMFPFRTVTASMMRTVTPARVCA